MRTKQNKGSPDKDQKVQQVRRDGPHASSLPFPRTVIGHDHAISHTVVGGGSVERRGIGDQSNDHGKAQKKAAQHQKPKKRFQVSKLHGSFILHSSTVFGLS